MIANIIRIALTIGLLYLVYGETGPWTAAALALITVGLEVNVVLLRRIRNTDAAIDKIVDDHKKWRKGPGKF